MSPEREARLIKGVGVLKCRRCPGEATPVDIVELDETHLLVCFQPDCLCFRQTYLAIDVAWFLEERRRTASPWN